MFERPRPLTRYLPPDRPTDGSAACNASADCVRVDLDKSVCVTVRAAGLGAAELVEADGLAQPAKAKAEAAKIAATNDGDFMG